MGRGGRGAWQRELDDITRGFSGAFLFGIPLLYTMEMWWIGLHTEEWKLLLMLALACATNFGLAHFAGFKRQGHTFGKALEQAVDAVAIGAVASAVVLLVLNRIAPGDPLASVVGQVIVQAVPLSIGASVANAVFAGRGTGRQGDAREGGGGQDSPGGLGAGDGESGRPAPGGVWSATLNDLGATVTGGVFVGFSIAPTEEVPMLAVELGLAHKLALIGLSLVVTYAIVFASGFDPQHAGGPSPGLFQHPLTETALAYVVSLLVALVVLILFAQIDPRDSVASIVAQALVLGFVTSIGGAAGRLVI